MQSQKPQKIDLNSEYPCPCRRKGRLIPIMLTEALGCDHCQQIFVVEDNGYKIEQLSANYPYKKSWRWTGTQWITAHSGFLRENYLPLALIAVIVMLIWLVITIITIYRGDAYGVSNSWKLTSIAVWLFLALVPAMVLWLAYRRPTR